MSEKIRCIAQCIWFMLWREIRNLFYSANHVKRMNTLCWQNSKFSHSEAGCTCSLSGWTLSQTGKNRWRSDNRADCRTSPACFARLTAALIEDTHELLNHSQRCHHRCSTSKHVIICNKSCNWSHVWEKVNYICVITCHVPIQNTQVNRQDKLYMSKY